MRNRILSTRLTDDQIALFYLGQEGFVIKFRDKYILIDAYLSDHCNRCGGVPGMWRRQYDPPMQPRELDFIDAVFVTHGHDDHADPDTLSELVKVNHKAVFVCPEPIGELMASFGIPRERILPARVGEEMDFGWMKVIPVPAAHDTLQVDEAGRSEALGYRFSLGGIELFHAGDTLLYEGVEDWLEGVDVAMLPVNGRDFFRTGAGIVGNMDAREAAVLCATLGVKLLIPMHYDLFAVNDLPLSLVAGFIERYGEGVPFHAFRPGERLIWAK